MQKTNSNLRPEGLFSILALAYLIRDVARFFTYGRKIRFDFFSTKDKEATSDFKISDVLGDFCDAKGAAGVRERSITQLRSTLDRLSTALPDKVRQRV